MADRGSGFSLAPGGRGACGGWEGGRGNLRERHLGQGSAAPNADSPHSPLITQIACSSSSQRLNYRPGWLCIDEELKLDSIIFGKAFFFLMYTYYYK